MNVHNLSRVAAFITKDGSEIRELLGTANSCVRNQTLAEARLPAGGQTARHHHVRTEEIYYILAGQALMQIGEETASVGPGDAIAIPPGSSHQITNTGTDALHFLCCCARATAMRIRSWTVTKIAVVECLSRAPSRSVFPARVMLAICDLLPVGHSSWTFSSLPTDLSRYRMLWISAGATSRERAMVQPRPFFAWSLLGLLMGLLVLCLALPLSFDEVFHRPKRLDVVPSKQTEIPKSSAIVRLPPVEETIRRGVPVGVTSIPWPPRGEVSAIGTIDAGRDGSAIVTCSNNDEPAAGGPSDPPHYPRNEAVFLPAPQNPQSVASGVHFGAQVEQLPPQQTAVAGENGPALPPSQTVLRLPTVVANMPAPIREAPRTDVQPNPAQPAMPLRISESERERAERRADDSWREPDTLLEGLKGLAASGPTSAWAAAVVRQIQALGPAVAGGSDESVGILERLADLNRQAPQLAEKITDKELARRLMKTNFALRRRLDVWQEVVRLGVPQVIDTTTTVANPERLAICLAKVDWLTRDSAEGQAWRQYLLVDALRESSRRPPSAQDHTTQQLAQRVLERITETPKTPDQQKFISSGPVAVLREELRRWAAEPIGAAVVLRDIETYERSGLPSDARRLALDYQHLTVSPVDGRRRLADRIDLDYRNGNCRIAIAEELLNKLMPTRNLEYAPVDDTVLKRPVRGESVMATEMAIRMVPNPQRVRLALEVTGSISSLTTTEAGPARFHNDSQSYYVARKPLEIDMNGISVWPVEVDVQNETHMRGVDTSFDGIPLISAVARGVAKSQMAQNSSAASQEVKQKVADKASQRIDAETRESLSKVVQFMNERVFDPLNSLSLDPQLVEAKTTPSRFVMRLRLAGEDQLGSHTPRPQALEDSLASVQIHESVLNNVIQRLQLNGQKFTLPELSHHIAARLHRPMGWDINPDHAGVTITFAKKDAVVVRCLTGQPQPQDQRLVLTLSIAELCRPSQKPCKNFQIVAYYRPQFKGRSAQLVRDKKMQINPRVMSLTTRMALAAIFTRALSDKTSWELMPDRILKEPKLDYTAITQFEIEDGWIGISLGRQSQAVNTAPAALGVVVAHKFGGSLSLETDFENLELERPLRDNNLDPVARFLAHQPLRQRASDENLARIVVLFAGAHQGELLFVAEVEVLHADGGTEGDLILGDLREIDEHGPRELVAEHVDAGFHHAPAFLGPLVLGILR